MPMLKDTPDVAKRIGEADEDVIKNLHYLLYDEIGVRNRREKIKKFPGFEFEKGSVPYQEKTEFLTKLDNDTLNAFGKILGVTHSNKYQLINKIWNMLIKTDISIESIGDGSYIKDRTVENRINEHSTIDFRDIEPLLKKFNGTDNYPIEKWVQDIETEANIQSWSSLQLFNFGRRLITGLARLFIESERHINTWGKLKEALLEEFSLRVNSADIHKQLARRKLQRGEHVYEYFLIMRELASRGNLEDEALIEYILDGIQDNSHNKTILYGAKTIKELKEKLKIYSEIISKAPSITNRTYSKQPVISETRGSNKRQMPARCSSCGSKQHVYDTCPTKHQGYKCFHCNLFGHKAAICPQKQELNKKTPQTRIATITKQKKEINYKPISMGNETVNALIDTGASLSLINGSTYKKIGSPQLISSNITLNGFARSRAETKGYFKTIIRIDGEEFNITFYVVSDDLMKEQAILGIDLTEQAEIKINREGISINKRREDVEELSIFNIDIAEENTINIDSRVKSETRGAIMQMITDYTPKRIKSTNIKMKLILKDEEPIYFSPRRLPFSERKILDDQVTEWLEQGIIEPCQSEYASQAVIVKKKNGAYRVCFDFRKINDKIIKDRYPLPLIEDQLDRLQKARYFSTLDLKNGFFHVEMDEESKKYTAFVTHNGHYQFRKVPFGLCNSPAIFQRFINTIFQDLIAKNMVLPYMDDLIIPSENEDEAVERLKTVVARAEEYGLEINWKKCQFVKTNVEFLGHQIENGKLFPSEFKVKAIAKFPEPKTIKQVQSYLGLSGYFRKFIPFYSIIAKPLSNLLKKEQKFQFGPQEKEAFDQLKKALINKPVLKIYDQEGEIELHTDASIDGYGSILLQKSLDDNHFHPVYYFSKKTTDTERKLSSYELEVLAVINSLKKLRVYLLGRHFKIITDCSAFQKTMYKKDLSAKIARWAILLSDFDYTIEHRIGKRMPHVDALSRNPIMFINTSIVKNISERQDEDDRIKAIKEILKKQPYEDYLLKDNVLYIIKDNQELLVLPERMQDEIIKSAHEQGHFSVRKTEDLINKEYYIHKAREKIEKIIRNCVPCILANRKQGKKEGFLHPLHKESTPLHTYHIDHIGPLESTNKNYKHILVVIDAFTKFVWLYPTKSTTTKEVIQKLDAQKKIFGSPSNIISDKGTAFTSQEFKDYCHTENINHFLITAGLPRANGQVERINAIIIPVLTKLSLDNPSQWYRHIDTVQRVINSTYQRSIGTTPFQLLTGVKLKMPTEIKIKEAIEEEVVKTFQKERHKLREQAKEQIVKIQQENRQTYDPKRCAPRQYEVGGLVAIKRTQVGPGSKLKPKFLGPYRIIRKKMNDTYDVKKEAFTEGPIFTSTCAEYMKPWSLECNQDK